MNVGTWLPSPHRTGLVSKMQRSLVFLAALASVWMLSFSNSMAQHSARFDVSRLGDYTASIERLVVQPRPSRVLWRHSPLKISIVIEQEWQQVSEPSCVAGLADKAKMIAALANKNLNVTFAAITRDSPVEGLSYRVPSSLSGSDIILKLSTRVPGFDLRQVYASADLVSEDTYYGATNDVPATIGPIATGSTLFFSKDPVRIRQAYASILDLRAKGVTDYPHSICPAAGPAFATATMDSLLSLPDREAVTKWMTANNVQELHDARRIYAQLALLAHTYAEGGRSARPVNADRIIPVVKALIP